MLTKRKTGDGLHTPVEGVPARHALHASRPVPLRAAALAALLAMGAVVPLQAHALGLGRVTVLSALGEPLKADVDVVEISADEASSLTVSIAPAAAFRAAGVDYNAALTGARVSLQQRADGSRYLRISGDRSVSEPYLDLILEANWASGRLTRDYTLLFDPADLRAAPAPAPLAAQIPATPAAAPPPAPVPAPAVAAVEPVKPATAPSPVAAARPAPPAAVARVAAPAAGTVTVRPGDTATKLVAPLKADGISLDQLLIALLRANPDAFIGSNVNRLRAGAVVDLPSAEQAQAVNPAEARRLLAVQSSDFNDFRRRLATATPATAGGAGGREASGRVQTQVQESTVAAAAPDKLKLSKGAVKPGTREAQVAQSREKQEATTRVAELKKNLGDLAKLQASSAAVASATAPTQKASGLALPVGTPVAAAASAPKPASAAASAAKPASAAASVASTAVVPPAASAPASAAGPAQVASAAPTAPILAASAPASAPAESASAVVQAASAPAPASVPAASKPPVKKLAPPPPPPEPSFIDSLMDNPLVPAGLVGLVALLGGYGFYRMRQRKAAAQADSSFLESRVQPDSFFGSSGGQHVDTNDESPPSGNASSLNYSPSQLDAGGDVDPVAEADVYLAYGRDLQAEEILKEALKVHPGRIAIHAKLLEIHAKRRDARAFEVVARQAYKLSHGQGSEWEHICELGRSIDAENPLYQKGGAPKEPPAQPEPASAAPFAPSTIPVMPKPEFAPSGPAANLDFDLDLGGPSVLPDDAAASAPAPLSAAPAPATDFDFTPAPAAKPAAKDSGLLEFDLSDLSLDLPKNGADATAAPVAAPVSVSPQGQAADSFETKLSLAKEFHEIGDVEGARVLVEEVIANAPGPIKAKAERFLAELS